MSEEWKEPYSEGRLSIGSIGNEPPKPQNHKSSYHGRVVFRGYELIFSRVEASLVFQPTKTAQPTPQKKRFATHALCGTLLKTKEMKEWTYPR